MEVLLNGNRLQYDLQGASTVGDLISSLGRWLAKRGAVIVSARLDGSSLDISGGDEEVRLNESVNDHNCLELECQNARLLVLETLNDLSQYLGRVARLAPTLPDKGNPEDDVAHLVEGLKWCLDVLARVEQLLQISFHDIEFEGETLHRHILHLGDVVDHINEGYRNKNQTALNGIFRDTIGPMCDMVVRAIPVILHEANLGPADTELSAEVDDLLPLMKNMPEMLERIAVKISLGDTGRGMEEFAAATRIIERAFQLVDRCRQELPMSLDDMEVDGQSFEARSKRLSDVLDELIAAFNNNDRVLISDLVEYEIAPETEVIVRILEKIQNSSKRSCH